MYVDEKVITCCHDNCGISFAVPGWWHKGKVETHSTFYCPNGHAQSFRIESDLEIMRRARDRAVQEQARLQEELNVEARLRKRAEKRAAAGTCPCCQRTFSNMATHMKRQHPQFVADAGANVIPIKHKSRAKAAT